MKISIQKIVTQLKEIRILEKQLQHAIQVKEEQGILLLSIDSELDKNLTQSKALDSMSLSSLFAVLTKSKNVKLELLKSHYLRLAVERKDLSLSIKHLEWEIQLLSKLVDKQQSLKSQLTNSLSNYSGEFDDKTLKTLQVVSKAITEKVSLQKEIIEAIDQGVTVNKKINKLLRLLKTKAHEIYSAFNDSSILKSKKATELDKYQSMITSLKHSVVKLEIEVGDIYDAILKGSGYSNNLVSSFISEYKMSLVSDLLRERSMNSSYGFLIKFKKSVMALTKSLRRDKQKIDKEVSLLQEEYSKILRNIN